MANYQNSRADTSKWPDSVENNIDCSDHKETACIYLRREQADILLSVRRRRLHFLCNPADSYISQNDLEHCKWPVSRKCRCRDRHICCVYTRDLVNIPNSKYIQDDNQLVDFQCSLTDRSSGRSNNECSDHKVLGSRDLSVESHLLNRR